MIDTAGLRPGDEPADAVERIGIERSWAAIQAADVVVFLHDLTRVGQPGYDAAEQRVAAALPTGLQASGRLLHVFNQADVGTLPEGSAGLALSALTGAGLDTLRDRLLALAGWHAQPEGLFIARTRHVQALKRTREHLVQAREQAALRDAALDLLAEELRLAHASLGEITGAFTPDDLLGEIFSRFCIGK